MASERETLADIVAEIRAYGAQPPPRLMWLEIADRIEAASRRECESVGNAAATREALETIHDKVNRLDEECGVDPVEIRDLARAALSAPPRNCDVGTAEEQATRLDRHCENTACNKCPARLVPHKKGEYDDRCVLKWAQTPYTAQEGENNG